MTSIWTRFFACACVAFFSLASSASLLPAATIGYGTADGNITNPFDVGWAARLESQGHTVIGLGDDEPLPDGVEVSDFDLFIVSDHVLSGNWINGPVGIDTRQTQISWEQALMDDFFGSDDRTVNGPRKNIDIVDASHPLANGLPEGVVTLLSGLGNQMLSMGTDDLVADAHVVALAEPGRASIVELPTGKLDGRGVVSEGCRIGFFPEDGNPFEQYTPDALALLDAAVEHGIACIPEPASVALMLTGLVAVAALRRRNA